MSWICTRQDLYALGGLPPGAYVPDALEIAGVDVATSSLELRGHGFFGGELVRFAAGAGSTLYAGIVARTWYTVAPTADPDFFTLLLAGVPVVVTDAGSGSVFMAEDVTPKIDRRLLERTSYLVARAKAYAGPWTTPPDWAPGVVSRLVAWDLAVAFRVPAARYPVDKVEAQAATTEVWIADELAKGVPMGDGVGPVDATPTIPEQGAKLVTLARGDFDNAGEFRA